MSAEFHTNYREETLISRLENSRQSAWGRQLSQLGECIEELSQRLALKLVDNHIVETTNQQEVEGQLAIGLNDLLQAEDFDIQYLIAPVRNLMDRPNRMSLYITAYILEKLIKHRSVVDIFGTDEEVYATVNQEVTRLIR